MTDPLISLVEAAALIQPFVSDINAFNLLTDWRRKSPRYVERVKTVPRFEKIGGKIAYRRSELNRIIRELVALAWLRGGV